MIAALVALIVTNLRTGGGAASSIEGIQNFDRLDRTHVANPVNYPQTPPVGGAHSATWQNCGYYPTPVQNELGVHSLEHGAVWITYRPDLSGEQVQALRQLTTGQTYILISPFANLPTAVVASAWGKQVQLDSPDDPRLREFIRAYRNGPQTPEPGASCTGGAGQPQ